MLRWPSESTAAQARLFRGLQNIDVYVEDNNDHVFYLELIKKISPSGVVVETVFPLGGADKVAEQARGHDFIKRKAFFVIDGDLYCTRGICNPYAGINGLHIHERYCIENFLIDESAIATIVSEELVKTHEEVKAMLSFDSWIREISPLLVSLFASFSLVHEVDPTIKTVGDKVGVLCVKRGNSSVLDSTKVQNKIDELLNLLRKNDGVEVDTLYDAHLSRIHHLPYPLHVVSGKDFLLPLVQFLLNSIGCKVKTMSLRIRLLKALDKKVFNDMEQSFVKAIK